MKKITALALCLIAGLAPLSAEISVGLAGGYSYTVDNLQDLKDQDYDVTQDDFPLFAEAGWKTTFETDVPAFGEIALVAGIRAGYLDIESATPPKDATAYTKIDLSTIPLLAFCRVEAGYVYADLSGGVHFWDIGYRTDVSDLGNSGCNGAVSFSAGARLPILDLLVLRAGPSVSYYSIPEFSDNLGASSLTIGLFAGLNLEL